MRSLLQSDVWLLMILAAVVAAILVSTQSSSKAAKLGAFFTVLGDALVLLALLGSEDSDSGTDSAVSG